MLELLIWGALTLLITVGTGGAIVLTDRRKRREAQALRSGRRGRQIRIVHFERRTLADIRPNIDAL